MHLHMNHMFCFRSHWDGNPFRCRYFVSIDKYDNRSCHPSYEVESANWRALLDFKDVYSQEEYDRHMEFYNSDKNTQPRDAEKEHFLCDMQAQCHNVPFLKPEVEAWLNENVADASEADLDDWYDDQAPKGWCMGTDGYRAKDTFSLGLFFVRKADAKAFAERWSLYGNVLTYCDYFNDIRGELMDGKLVRKEY